jgi:fructokinase
MPSHTDPSPTVRVFGEVLFDHFPDGTRVLGGAPFNVAWHLHAFGAAPRLISAVGDDAEGAAVRTAMRDWGMSTADLQVSRGHGTGMVEVSFHAGEPRYEILSGRAYDHVRAPPEPAAPSLLYHGTLALRHGVSAATLGTLRATADLVFLDVNLRAPWWSRESVLGWIEGTDWVKLNHEELGWLEGADLPASTGLAARVRAFFERHRLSGLVVTLGAEGAIALSGERASPMRIAPAPMTRVVDTVGAGDAFAAVLILGILNGWPLTLALERAQDFATRIVGMRGATVADPSLYAGFREDWGLTQAR